MVPVLQIRQELGERLGALWLVQGLERFAPSLSCPTPLASTPSLSSWCSHQEGGSEGPCCAKAHADHWAELGEEHRLPSHRKDMGCVCPDQNRHGVRSPGEKGIKDQEPWTEHWCGQGRESLVQPDASRWWWTRDLLTGHQRGQIVLDSDSMKWSFMSFSITVLRHSLTVEHHSFWTNILSSYVPGTLSSAADAQEGAESPPSWSSARRSKCVHK